jgi:hypothetical protein
LIRSRRLSLMKGAHADLSNTAEQEIGVKPYFGLSGDTTALDAPFFALGAKPREHIPFCGVARSPGARSHPPKPT